ncbi:MAG: T9SS type A sorting domain-containing protein [Nitrospiraceae bacterium]|nr:T9SS type A sorting domain-containing protein [Nitrospiraceae bacterium]
MIAVSKTNDPTGEWYRWSYAMDDLPDYPHFGIWQNGYYMAVNDDDSPDVFAFDRDAMINGDADPQMVAFDNDWRPNSGFHIIQPLDNDGDWAPSGTPGQFITIDDDAWGSSQHVNDGKDELWLFELDVDWDDASNATFDRTQVLVTADFDSDMGSGMDNVAQKDESQKVDAIAQILMYRAQYRNFNGDQLLVCAHTVDVDDSDHGGIRWYELEKTSADGDWSIRQQGTYAPDGYSRFQPSIAMDKHKNIAIGYSISSTNMYPGIRYAGQSCKEHAKASGKLDIPEETVYDGTQSQSENARWGDYADLSVDPTDDLTFWFTNEYYDGKKKTKVAVFKFPSCGDVEDLLAEAKSTSKIDVSWTPNDERDKVLLAYTMDGTFGDPTDGHEYAVGDDISGGGKVLAYGNDTLYHHTGLDCNTKYYYKAWSYQSDDTYSDGQITNATTWSDTITIQPRDAAVCDGGDTSFSIHAEGVNLTYQWQKNGSDIAGATDTILKITNVSSDDEADYKCIVSGDCSDLESNTVSLHISDKTNITTDPSDVEVCESSSATFTVVSDGESLTYQWQKDGGDITGATSASYTIANVTNADKGKYRCIVNGGCQSDTSLKARLMVKDTVILINEDFEELDAGTTPPANWSRNQGNPSSSDDAYGWEFGTASDVKSSNFDVPDHTKMACSNDDKHTSSNFMSTTHNDASEDSLLTFVVDLSSYEKANLTFDAYFKATDNSDASDNSTAHVNISTDGGATWTSVHNIPSDEAWEKQTVDLTSYVGESNVMIGFSHDDNGDQADGTQVAAFGFAIDNVLLQACSPLACKEPLVTTQPNSQEVSEGDDVTFTMDADGSADLTYQWQKDGADISGATDSTYTISGVTTSDAGDYTCVVTNGCGTDTTSIATLKVNVTTIITQSECAQDNIRVYPNPLTSVLNIELPVTNVTIKVVDMVGRTIRELNSKDEKTVSLDLEDLANGVYNLVLITQTENIVFKLIKE